jgi:SsrA-binding protein
MPDKKTKFDNELLAQNRKARFHYHVIESLEAGIELCGTEVKSIKAHEFSLDEGFAQFNRGQLFLHNVHVQPYKYGNRYNHTPDRLRRLLLHREELDRLESATSQKGLTLVPLDIHVKKGRVKVLIGLCKGKNVADKRDSLKKKESDRDLKRIQRLKG